MCYGWRSSLFLNLLEGEPLFLLSLSTSVLRICPDGLRSPEVLASRARWCDGSYGEWWVWAMFLTYCVLISEIYGTRIMAFSQGMATSTLVPPGFP